MEFVFGFTNAAIQGSKFSKHVYFPKDVPLVPSPALPELSYTSVTFRKSSFFRLVSADLFFNVVYSPVLLLLQEKWVVTRH